MAPGACAAVVAPGACGLPAPAPATRETGAAVAPGAPGAPGAEVVVAVVAVVVVVAVVAGVAGVVVAAPAPSPDPAALDPLAPAGPAAPAIAGLACCTVVASARCAWDCTCSAMRERAGESAATRCRYTGTPARTGWRGVAWRGRGGAVAVAGTARGPATNRDMAYSPAGSARPSLRYSWPIALHRRG